MKNILKVALMAIIATCNADNQSDIIKKATEHRMNFEGKVMNDVFDAVKSSKLQEQLDKAIAETATKNVKGVKLVGFVINGLRLEDKPDSTPVSMLISLHDDQSAAYHFVKNGLTVTKGLEAFAYDHNAPKDYHLLDDTLKFAIRNNAFKTAYNISPARKEALKAALNTAPGTEFKHTEFVKNIQFTQERVDLSLAKTFPRVLKATKLKISSDELYIDLINLLGKNIYNKEDIKKHAIDLANHIVSNKFAFKKNATKELKIYCANKSFQEGSNEYKMILATSAIVNYFHDGGKSQEFLINKCIQSMSLTQLPIEISHQIREAMQPIFQSLEFNASISAIITEKIPLLKTVFKNEIFKDAANTLINAFAVLVDELNLNSDEELDIMGDGMYFYSLYLKFSSHNDRLLKLLASKFAIEHSLMLEPISFDLIFPESEFITNNANKDILTLFTQKFVSHREFAGITAYSSSAMQAGDNILNSSANTQKFIALLKNSPALLTPNVRDILHNDKIGTTPITSEDFLNMYIALKAELLMNEI